MRSVGNNPFVKQVDFVEQHKPTIVHAAFDAHAVKLLELELEHALDTGNRLFRARNRRGRQLTRYVAVLEGSILKAAALRAASLPQFLAACSGGYKLLRVQINLYPARGSARKAPAALTQPGHAMHRDGLGSDELTVILNLGPAISQRWEDQNGTEHPIYLERGDAVVFNRRTDQQWLHGCAEIPPRGAFRARGVLRRPQHITCIARCERNRTSKSEPKL